MMPSAQQSPGSVYWPPSQTSGGMWCMLPSRLSSAGPSQVVALMSRLCENAMPKSPTFATPRCVSRMLLAFRSRWTMPCLWMYWTPHATCTKTPSAEVSEKPGLQAAAPRLWEGATRLRRRLTSSSRSPASQNSDATTRCCSWRNARWIRRTFGCAKVRRTCTSWSARWRRRLVRPASCTHFSTQCPPASSARRASPPEPRPRRRCTR
mmetsp:Transcript_117604/g.333287  ORF Transcript_117604/g.333287 Transcript_117604/m.333287 type:complete len:208 (-) Transcript_117604:8-631(-)